MAVPCFDSGMHWTKPLALLGVILLALLVLGGLALLVTAAFSKLAVVAALAVVVVLVAVTTALGAKSRRWRANPYW